MSGGSYNYLCFVDAGEILQRQQDLQVMADDLAKLGYAPDAAKETENLLLTVRQFDNRIQTMLDRMSPVWRAMEWWHSADSNEDDFKVALAKYRGETS